MFTEYQQVIIDTANAKAIDGPAGTRLPTMFAFHEYVARPGGGLMSMGPNFVEMFENGAVTAHDIINGGTLQKYGVKVLAQDKLVINTQTEPWSKWSSPIRSSSRRSYGPDRSRLVQAGTTPQTSALRHRPARAGR
ncbi:MAG: hypothetical protein K2Z80_19715 [Xanthobacteraceae bacterium]|nr:hypothetical protein [Xanthobacteraceae bacterium]